MKTFDLIKLLQEADPNNECIVSTDNCPVHDVIVKPWYYDGRICFVDKDEKGHPIKAGYRPGPNKICIYSESIQDALYENPELELDLSGITSPSGEISKKYKEMLDLWRKEARELKIWTQQMHQVHKEGKPMPKIKGLWRDSIRAKIKKVLLKLKIIN